jgi:4-amino-4-deoxy-L-arabinose transferase-like glycosyltransferase
MEDHFEPIPQEQVFVEVVIPVLNEEAILLSSITRLKEYLDSHLPYRYRITIAENGSSDGTALIAAELHMRLPNVEVSLVPERGRGGALKKAWTESDANILTYMDVDLSTDLRAFIDLLPPLIEGKAVLATGSRLRMGARVERSLGRELISRAYNRLLKWTLHLQTSDAQCGFKAIRADAAAIILPEIADNAWFFDSELLAKAERRGWTIHELPVNWTEDKDSRVRILKTALGDLKGIARLRREFDETPAWQHYAFALLLIGTFFLFFLGLWKNGYANNYYAAAVQAGSKSWKAFFFGSLDQANFITVDKSPFALWVMGISCRIFGFGPLSMLLPNALAGVASVFVLTRIVRRRFGGTSALIAGIAFALTPVAALMFRFNNPDSILTLLLLLSAYTFIRSMETGKTSWLIGTGILVGTAFLTKMLQAFIVVPIFGIIYLCCAQPRFLKRLWQLAVAGAALAAASLWWPAIVWLTPASSRPYIGGSTDNSIWNLVFGYNGLGRLSGNGAGGGGGGGGFGGATGIFRMFNSEFAANISWLIPIALIVLLAGLYYTRRRPRTDLTRVHYLLWGGWLILHVIVFSAMQGVIHPYYTVIIAPSIAALLGMGCPLLLKLSQRKSTRYLVPACLIVSGGWVWVLLGRYADWLPWLRWSILAGSILIAAAFLLNGKKRLLQVGAVAALICLLAGPFAFSIVTANSVLSGSLPSAGPSTVTNGMVNPGNISGRDGGNPPAMVGTLPIGNGFTDGGDGGGGQMADEVLVEYLMQHKESATWIVATVSANTAATIELASGQPVMAIGGFTGNDPAPSLEEFLAYVVAGEIEYVLMDDNGSGPGMGGGNNGSQVSSVLVWVQEHGTKVDYGGSQTLYLVGA